MRNGRKVDATRKLGGMDGKREKGEEGVHMGWVGLTLLPSTVKVRAK